MGELRNSNDRTLPTSYTFYTAYIGNLQFYLFHESVDKVKSTSISSYK